jgi:hypothetical protein
MISLLGVHFKVAFAFFSQRWIAATFRRESLGLRALGPAAAPGSLCLAV